MNDCEKAFIAYLKAVLPDVHELGRNGIPLTDETILATWHEFFDDWCVAARWGQENPCAVAGASRVRLRKKEPKFLHTMEDSWEEAINE